MSFAPQAFAEISKALSDKSNKDEATKAGFRRCAC